MTNLKSRISFDFGQYKARVDARLIAWTRRHFLSRLWGKDYTLWSAEPVPELSDRLGWLALPQRMSENLEDILQFADGIKSDKIAHIVLLGMGGSSLAPEVFARSFGSAPGYPELIVLDSTHPDAVTTVRDRLELDHTFFLVSSKSGTTLETLSLFRYFWDEMRENKAEPGEHFGAITDPESPLERLAEERKFRAVFEAPPDVGGRFSALSVFGLVPAALIGLDVRCLLERALRGVEDCYAGVSPHDSAALMLGALLGELAGDRNKVTFLSSPSLASFSDWVEQLIAESTGKEEKGILPVVHEPLLQFLNYSNDRLFVGLFCDGTTDSELEVFFRDVKASDSPSVWINLGDHYDLGLEFFRWEVAVAAACSVLGINPFNQPDVQLSKDLTRRVMMDVSGTDSLDGEDFNASKTKSAVNQNFLVQEFEAWIRQARAGDYIAIQAYLAPSPNVEDALQGIRAALLERTRLATTLGFGPRYLHSTGQLHKGGPNQGLFLHLVDKPTSHIPVPETDYAFDAIIQAQSIGDYKALTERRRRILRVDLGRNILEGLDALLNIISL